MKITLIRHGETEENAINDANMKIYQWQLDTNLNEIGIKQSLLLCNFLEKQNRPNFIFCSDLSRTKNTIKPFVQKTKYHNIRYDKKIRERNFWDYNWILVSEFQKWCRNIWWIRRKDHKPPNWESIFDLQQRAIDFIDWLYLRYADQDIRIVSHAGWIKFLLSWIFQSWLDKFEKSNLYSVNNCSITRLEIMKWDKKLIELNNTSHLKDLYSTHNNE